MNTKKLLSLILILALAAALMAGCGGEPAAGTENDNPSKVSADLDGQVSAPIVIAALNGPTGVGLAPMMDDARFDITVYQSPDEITGKIITGEVDIAAVPTNLASVLYNKTGGNIKTISTTTLGVLYLVEDGWTVTSMADLKGKTIYASGKGGVPEYVLQELFLSAGLNPESDVTVQWMGTHADVAAKLKADKATARDTGSSSGTIALLPEPQVSILRPLTSSYAYHVIDLNKEWTSATGQPLPMGVLVAQKAFIEENGADLDIFLANAKASVQRVNQAGLSAADQESQDESAQEETRNLLVEKGFFKDAMTAAQAIPGCNLAIFTGEDDYRTMLDTFYQTLFELEPKSVGGKLPDDAFYN